MGKYNVDFNRLVLQTLPIAIRRSRLFALLSSAFLPIRRLFQYFGLLKGEIDEKLQIEPTIESLEMAINAKFGQSGNVYTIIDGDYRAIPYIYRQTENKPVTNYLYKISEEMPITVTLWLKDTEAGRYRNGITFKIYKTGGGNWSMAERDAVLAFVDEHRAAGCECGIY